jgi:hypothetical protein
LILLYHILILTINDSVVIRGAKRDGRRQLRLSITMPGPFSINVNSSVLEAEVKFITADTFDSN